MEITHDCLMPCYDHDNVKVKTQIVLVPELQPDNAFNKRLCTTTLQLLEGDGAWTK